MSPTNFFIENYLQAVAISLLLSGLIIPKIILIAFRRKLFDQIDERKIHHGVVPRLGGIAFLPAMMFSICLVMGCDLRYSRIDIIPYLEPAVMPMLFVVCGIVLMYLVGIADDLVGVRYRAKFIFQIVSGILIVGSGLWISNFYGLLWIDSVPAWFGCVFTIIALIGIVNAFNLIDGIDGLCSGLAIVGLLFYTIMFYAGGAYIWLLLAGATIGTLIPFFCFNVFGKAEKHNKIFMGDTGSLTLGLTMGVMFLTVVQMDGSNLPYNHNRLILAISPVLIPCLDVARVFLHRIRRGRSPFLPDKCHIHHKFLALGLGQRLALILILLIDLLFIVGNYSLSEYIGATWLILGDIVVWVVLNLILTAMIERRERLLGKKLYD